MLRILLVAFSLTAISFTPTHANNPKYPTIELGEVAEGRLPDTGLHKYYYYFTLDSAGTYFFKAWDYSVDVMVSVQKRGSLQADIATCDTNYTDVGAEGCYVYLEAGQYQIQIYAFDVSDFKLQFNQDVN